MPLLFGDLLNFALEFLLFCTSGFMILLVLVQRGRGGGLTGALGGMGGQSAFGAKAGDVFTRITVISAIVWIFLCLITIMNYTYVEVDSSNVGEYNYEVLVGDETAGDAGTSGIGTNPDDGPGATVSGTDPVKDEDKKSTDEDDAKKDDAKKDADEKSGEPGKAEPEKKKEDSDAKVEDSKKSETPKSNEKGETPKVDPAKKEDTGPGKVDESKKTENDKSNESSDPKK